MIERVAGREVELGIVGALRRNRSLVFEPLARDEIVLAVPPATRLRAGSFRGRPGAETLVVMQEGPACGRSSRRSCDAPARLRSRAAPGAGLQESVKSAVAAGYGVAFISRTAIEGELAAGTLASARVAGIEPPVSSTSSVPRAARRQGPRRHSSSSPTPGSRRDRSLGPHKPFGLLAELGIRAPLVITTRRWDELELRPRRFSGVRQHVPTDTVEEAVAAAEGADGLVAIRGGSAIDTAKAVAAPRQAGGLDPNHVLGCRVDGRLRRPRRGAWPRLARRRPCRGDRLRPGADARPPRARRAGRR